MISENNYNLQKDNGNGRDYFVTKATINCKLKKGDHLSIHFYDFNGLDGFNTKDTYMFSMSVKKK